MNTFKNSPNIPQQPYEIFFCFFDSTHKCVNNRMKLWMFQNITTPASSIRPNLNATLHPPTGWRHQVYCRPLNMDCTQFCSRIYLSAWPGLALVTYLQSPAAISWLHYPTLPCFRRYRVKLMFRLVLSREIWHTQCVNISVSEIR